MIVFTGILNLLKLFPSQVWADSYSSINLSLLSHSHGDYSRYAPGETRGWLSHSHGDYSRHVPGETRGWLSQHLSWYVCNLVITWHLLQTCVTCAQKVLHRYCCDSKSFWGMLITIHIWFYKFIFNVQVWNWVDAA